MKWTDFIIFMATIFFGVMFIIGVALDAKKSGYIEACNDFYNGKLKYDLVRHEDGSYSWERNNN